MQLISCCDGMSSKSNFALSVLLVLAENGQSFINADSEQPTPKLAFVFEPRRISSRREPAVFDNLVGPFGTAQAISVVRAP
jgi:hypothetical protein